MDFSMLEPYLAYTVAENTVQDILIAVGIFLAVNILLHFFRSVIINKVHVLVQKTSAKFDNELVDMFKGVSGPFYSLLSLYLASHYIVLPDIVSRVIFGVFIVIAVYEVIRMIQTVILYGMKQYMLKGHEDAEQMTAVAKIIIRIALWSVGAVLVLSNLGFDVNSLIASMGIGGIAVALAVQNVLSDMFSSFSIYFDEPFKIGDFIIVGDDMGVVERIGLKTTRIRALQGEEIVIANAELTSARIQNFKKMQKRRVVFGVGVEYGTPLEKLKKIPDMIIKIVNAMEYAECDRVHFKEFADSSLNYEIVYYTLTGDYNLYMDTQQSINLGIVEAFEKEGISMAFPTRTVHMVQA